MSTMGEALEQAGRYLTEPHAQIIRPGDGDHDGPEDNPRAAQLLGKRADDVEGPGVLVIDLPCELGYRCPECADPEGPEIDWDSDERLTWSEYRGMLWCHVCERDYPSALCLAHDPIRATETFLNTLEQAVTRRATELQERTAPWAHELAEIERALERKRGDRAAEHVGAPLAELITGLIDEAHESGRELGGWQASDAITVEVLERALRPPADDPMDTFNPADPAALAERVHFRLGLALGWPP